MKGTLYSVEVTYSRTTFKSTGLLGEVNYDSDENPAEIPPSAIGYAAMVGQTFKMVINSQGEVKMIEGIDEDGSLATLESATENAAISTYFSQHILRFGASRTKTCRLRVDTDLFGKIALWTK